MAELLGTGEKTGCGKDSGRLSFPFWEISKMLPAAPDRLLIQPINHDSFVLIVVLIDLISA